MLFCDCLFKHVFVVVCCCVLSFSAEVGVVGGIVVLCARSVCVDVCCCLFVVFWRKGCVVVLYCFWLHCSSLVFVIAYCFLLFVFLLLRPLLF